MIDVHVCLHIILHGVRGENASRPGVVELVVLYCPQRQTPTVKLILLEDTTSAFLRPQKALYSLFCAVFKPNCASLLWLRSTPSVRADPLPKARFRLLLHWLILGRQDG